MTKSFAHLHCHSHYSTLDGGSDIDALIREAKRHGQTALAITDHGSLHGAVEFYKKAKAASIKPIIGMEAYVSPGSRLVKTPETRKNYHLTLLAKNRAGYQNLLKLATEANRTGFYYKPRVDWELLAAHTEGIICLSGCVAGHLPSMLLEQPLDRLWREKVARVADAFVKMYGDDYYLEIQNNGLEIQQRATEFTKEFARWFGIAPMVASSDCHYARREDAASQDLLLCIGTRAKLTDPKRMRFETDEFYLRSSEDMYAAFPGLGPAVERSQIIADSIDLELPLGERHFPVFRSFSSAAPTNDKLLIQQCLLGLRERLKRPMNDAECERIDRELTIIHNCGFNDYFLIIDGIFEFCRTHGIPASIRGSGVGALTSYALGFTDINALEYGLLFERFLDPSRSEPPDIDIDVCKERRGEVIQYIRDTYGNESVAQIGTFGTLGIKSAIRDAGRAMGSVISQAEINDVVKRLPKRPQNQAHLTMHVDDALAESLSLKRAYDENGMVRDLLDKVKPLVGLVRHIGTHAAGIVISDGPLDNHVPLCRVRENSELVTQYAMKEVEEVGLLKMDLLGLKTLTLLHLACDFVPDGVNLQNIPMDDAKTFRLFQQGAAKGVFQMESDGMQDWMKKLRPDCFEDLIALNALYRPGPLLGGMVETYVSVKRGRKKVSYVHPMLEPILSKTYGVMVYQEQVMQILHQVGGIDLTYAYTCIKAISKKKKEVMDKAQGDFMIGAAQYGFTDEQSDKLWSQILEFAKYGFNRAHAAAYALIAYRTAYLKAHYPTEFMAALLTLDIPNRNLEDLKKDKLTEHLKDCLRMKIPIVSPDVNISAVEFFPTPRGIIFALSAIKGCKHNLHLIPQAREAGGSFLSLQDFVRRVDIQAIGQAVVKSLIEAGAFDSTPGSRSDKVAALPGLVKARKKRLKEQAVGQMQLFHDSEEFDIPLVRVESRPKIGRLALERKLLGFCFSQGNDDDRLN